MATSGSTSRQSASKASTKATGDPAVARLEEQLIALAAELEVRDERQREFAEEHRMLRERYAALTERYEGMAQAISVSAGLTALSEGFETLASELAPLRQLVPSTTTEAASEAVLDAIFEVRSAAQTPSWEGVTTLGIQTWSIPWIGAPKTPAGQSPAGEGQTPGQSEYRVYFFQGEQP